MSNPNNKHERFLYTGDGEWLRSMIPFFICLMAMFLLSSVLVWPYIIQTAMQGGEMSEMCMNLIKSGGIGFGVSTVIMILVAMFQPDGENGYSVTGSLPLCLSDNIIATWIAMICMKVNPLGEIAVNGYLAILRWIVVLMMSLIISVLPALISVVIGIVTRLICGAVVRHRK